MSTHLLFDLKLINDGSQLGQNLIGLLVVFELGGNEIGKVTKGLGGVEDLEYVLALGMRLMFQYCRNLRSS